MQANNLDRHKCKDTLSHKPNNLEPLQDMVEAEEDDSLLFDQTIPYLNPETA